MRKHKQTHLFAVKQPGTLATTWGVAGEKKNEPQITVRTRPDEKETVRNK